MEYKVKISEKGKTRTRSVLIERVPYKVFIIAQRLEKLVQQVKDDNEIMQAYAEENRELAQRKPDGWKDAVKANNAEIKILRDRIYSVEDAGFFSERFEAIRLVLEANGIREDDELMNEKLWLDKMDYSEPMAFIESALTKDEDKKKLVEVMRSFTSRG
jgi:lipase chaperone LimK